MRKSQFCKALFACLFAVLLAAAAPAAPKTTVFTPQQMKRMSTFLSNFTELGFFNFDTEASGDDDMLHLGDDPSSPDLIRFGIMHNYINNFKSRIRNCPKKNCPHGSLVIEAKYVAEAVKKYFDIDLKHRSVDDSDPPYHYDGKVYHFEGADGEAVYYALVQKAAVEDGAVHMTGEVCNADDKTDRPWTFEAFARSSKWKGKDTWTIRSMRIKER